MPCDSRIEGSTCVSNCRIVDVVASNVYGVAGNVYGVAGNVYGVAGNVYGVAGNVYGVAGNVWQALPAPSRPTHRRSWWCHH